MGCGSWTESSYRSYSHSSGKGYDEATHTAAVNYSNTSQAFTSVSLDEALDPTGVVRECCDNDEHPETVPVILALDVTGSMGKTAIKIQKLLNPIMVKLFEEVKDVEIAVMAIGDCACDDYPIQFSQFESDIRIADNLDKVYFENGGGGNTWESYSAAWYMGLNHTDLDCWKRGKKGIIITMGDEKLNPYIPIKGKSGLCEATGDSLEKDIDTTELYKEAKKKFDMFHICVESGSYPNQTENIKTFQKVMGEKHAVISSVDDIADKIVDAVKYYANRNNKPSIIVEDAVPTTKTTSTIGEIGW